MNKKISLAVVEDSNKQDYSAKEELLSHASNEFVFAVVGHVGSGNSEIAKQLGALLKEEMYEVIIIKAREVIEEYAAQNEIPIPTADSQEKQSLSDVSQYQDCGDRIRLKKGILQ